MLGQFRLAGEWVRGEAGETLAQIAEFDRPPQEVSTGSWEALAAYSRAVVAWRRGDPDELAEQLLKEALAADPGFVAAQQELADFYISKARFAEGHAHWGKAVDLLSRRRVTFRERYRLETLYFEDSYQLKRQLESAQAWAVHYPGDESAQYFQGSSLFHHHRYAEAQRAFEAAWAVQPLGRTAGYLVALGWMISDAGVSDRWLAELKGLGNEALYLKWLGQTAFLRGEYGKALESFRGASETVDVSVKDQVLAYLTCLYAECGRYDLAVRHCREHVVEARRWGRRAILARRLLHLAYLEFTIGDSKAAAGAAREAATGEAGPQAVRDLATYYRLTKDLGELQRLEQITKDWPLLPLFTGVKSWVDGEMTYLKAGPAVAEGLYLKALEVASPYMWPPVAVGTGLDLWRGPSHVRRGAALWYLGQRHWPGILSGSGALGEVAGKLELFGRTVVN
jgi:tetratricopeptide (TPR) repeat protein